MTACFGKKGMKCADIQGENRVVGKSTVKISQTVAEIHFSGYILIFFFLIGLALINLIGS